MDIVLILSKKYPGAQWSLSGTEYADLDWFDESPKPTEEELIELWPTVEYEIKYDAAVSARQQQYAAISDPIFMQYQRDEATKQEWLNAVQAIKEANPYPELPAS